MKPILKKVVLKNGIECIIRSAQTTDANQLANFLDAILKDGEGMVLEVHEMKKDADEQRKWIQNFIDSPDEILLVAEAQNNIIGVVDFNQFKRNRLAHLGSLGMSLLREWRGFGLGSELLKELIDWAYTRVKIEKITLRVLGSNKRAILLYKKFGFIEEGRITHGVKYGSDRYDDDVLMGLPIR